MQSEELKPCPFCGCDRILDGYIRDGREIVCGKCRASVAAFHPDASKRAAERWNRRAESALSAAEPVDRYNADALMADGGDERQTAAEEVLTYLLVEVIGAPDDVPYSPNRAQLLIEDRLKRQPAPSVAVKALADAYKAGFEARIRSALSAQSQVVAGDEEWQTVPKHPTGRMIDAVVSMVDDVAPHPFILNLYRAMLAAAPAKQEGGHD